MEHCDNNSKKPPRDSQVMGPHGWMHPGWIVIRERGESVSNLRAVVKALDTSRATCHAPRGAAVEHKMFAGKPHYRRLSNKHGNYFQDRYYVSTPAPPYIPTGPLTCPHFSM